MRKSLDSHYVDNLLRRDWRMLPRDYHQKTHSITEEDVVKVETTDYGDYIVHKIYCHISGGTNNFYDYILKHWGPVWEIQDDIRFEVVVLSLPKEPYFNVGVNNPDDDDVIRDYGLKMYIYFEEGPFIFCWGDSSSFDLNPAFSLDGSTSAVNFHGIWILNPGMKF